MSNTENNKNEIPVLSAKHIVKHFPVGGIKRDKVVHATDDVSLDLYAGQVVALVGESGSGKSTIAKLLSQLVPITSGTIELNGQPVKAKSGKGFREYTNQVQMIFQDPFGSLNAVHTIRYILGRALQIHKKGLRGKKLEEAVIELLQRVKLTPAERYIDKFPHELSGGQRQRVSIARALAADPKVLLADEPISMLDVSIRLGILNLLKDLRDNEGIAILYITHDVASARYFADETLVMYAGRVIERGPSEMVTQHPAHPYTDLLVNSAPDPDALNALRGEAHGEAPSLIDPPSGCRFRTRCPFATELCAREVPPTVRAATGQEVACWLYTDNPEAMVNIGDKGELKTIHDMELPDEVKEKIAQNKETNS
ncbi:ABC transporter ATP-binding protein [Lactococcus protaetiae]|uniref:ABC transporter ATP-binding protein n=1 Tax=Lactococcus protaetiae TaxID=2592653 RepID=A0A514ZB43_9LACT|nr:ABC transporter ATP-binding protein [Lactococcus protaetiae]MCL2113757.1 ABC transporter ATP-binding protein [Streptococcaceae bacterium]QDK71800.1 ABC transporter ATP-binding protein [Lactococcus protaetiae]